MIVINPKSSTPIYEQVGTKLKELISKEALKSGDKLPSVRELACILMVNPNTISKAYSQLEQEDVFQTVRGKGTFVKDGAKIVINKYSIEQIKLEAHDLVTDAVRFNITYDDILHIVGDAYKALKGDCNDRN